MTCNSESLNRVIYFQTLFNSLSLGMIVSAYDLAIVSQAFFLTAMIVVGLTMYTLQSNKDFQWLSGILYSALMILSFGSLLHVNITFFLEFWRLHIVQNSFWNTCTHSSTMFLNGHSIIRGKKVTLVLIRHFICFIPII